MSVRVLVLVGVVLFSWQAGVALPQNTTRVSVDSTGAEVTDASWDSSISGDGRYVAFLSVAEGLVAGDTNGLTDVFVHDRRTGVTELVSVNSSGVQANDSSSNPVISADGRWVAFQSAASNLWPNDRFGMDDVFVHDRETGTTTLVSVDSNGKQGNGASFFPSISGGGRFVAFDTRNQLSPSDTNSWYDVYVHDRQTGATVLASVDSSGGTANWHSRSACLSGDGRFVAFYSQATNLVPGDTNAVMDIFVRDLVGGTTVRASVSSAGVEGDGDSLYPTLSWDGRLVAFESEATDLVPGDTNLWSDVFVRDLQAGTTTRVSVDSSGNEGNRGSDAASLSGDGRLVAFQSQSTNLVPGDTIWRDVLLHDRQTGRTWSASVNSAGTPAFRGSDRPAISADGRFVSFDSLAPNLVIEDTNTASDVFVHGPDLTLEASAEQVSAGDPLTLATWAGAPGGLVLLSAIEVHGAPLFLKIAFGNFDAAGTWTVAGSVPPALSGGAVTFLGLGITTAGKVELTNREQVVVQ